MITIDALTRADDRSPFTVMTSAGVPSGTLLHYTPTDYHEIEVRPSA